MKNKELIQKIVADKPSFVNCTGGCNGRLPTEVSFKDIDYVVNWFRHKIIQNIKEGEFYYTEDILAYVHPEVMKKVSYTSGFIPSSEHPEKSTQKQDEFGRTSNVHWIVNSTVPIMYKADAMGLNDVYPIYFVTSDDTIELRCTII